MAKRGGFPGGMPGNMNNLMKQAQKMQKQMEENQKALPRRKSSLRQQGGGAVEVTISGKKEVTKVKISEDAVDPDDVEMLEDLIMAATNEALRKVGGRGSQSYGANLLTDSAAWAEDSRSDGLLQRIHQSVDRAAVPSAWHRCENRTATGLSYYEYAGRPGKTAGRFDHRSKIPRPVLQVLPDPDRQRAVPDLRKCQARPQRDHGGGDDAGSCGI